ncbi:hypothetical protein D3C87_687410 [compost metagenome]
MLTTRHTSRAEKAMLVADSMNHADRDAAHAVPATNVRENNGFTGQIERLSLGQSAARVEAVDPGLRLVDLPDTLPLLRTKLRNNTNPLVQRAATRTGNRYTVEVTDVQTLGGLIYVLVIVTCISMGENAI